MFKAILLIFVLLGGIAAFIWVLLGWRESGLISGDFFKQIVSSLVSGAVVAIISFFFAYLLNNVQDEGKVKDIRMDSFIKIQNEISENRLTLGQEMKQEKPLIRLPLKTFAWDSGKYQTPIKTPLLLDGLKLLYDDIEKYNWNVEYMRYKVREQNLSIQNVPEQVWQPLRNVFDTLYAQLEEFEKLTVRESVILGNTRREEYENRFGKWEDKVNISYFSKKEETANKDVKK